MFVNAMKVYRDGMDWSSAKDAVRSAHFLFSNHHHHLHKRYILCSTKTHKVAVKILDKFEICKNSSKCSSSLTSNQAMEGRADEFLKFVLDASFNEKLYESVWPVLMMRLNDRSGSQYRHAMKSLAVIRHLLLRGSFVFLLIFTQS